MEIRGSTEVVHVDGVEAVGELFAVEVDGGDLGTAGAGVGEEEFAELDVARVDLLRGEGVARLADGFELELHKIFNGLLTIRLAGGNSGVVAPGDQEEFDVGAGKPTAEAEVFGLVVPGAESLPHQNENHAI